MTKLAKNKTAIKKSPAKVPVKSTAKISAKTSAVKSDDEKRLARNAELREWRAAHVEAQRAYMADWRARRKAKTASNTPSGNAAKPTTPTTQTEKGR